MRRADGIVLILVSALLTLLILLALATVQLSTSGRRISRFFVDRAHARLLAASGIECA
ncbi:MAG: hypothetical protein HY608_02265, partial [Planctomycetes bacterium]|nr:hypothetical protein [Planctomycetota bacterium]